MLKDDLLSRRHRLTETEWSALYSVYSVPNIILPLLGGIFVDKVGIRFALILFCFATTLGQLIFSKGGFEDSYMTMLLGRFIFGLGGECMGVANYAIIQSWFKG